VNCKNAKTFSCYANLQRSLSNDQKNLERNVQRLEDEDCQPIISPRAPSNSIFYYGKTNSKPKKTPPRVPSLFLQPCLESVWDGDASLQTQNHGRSYRLKFQQSDKLHREYLFHLHETFSDWVLSPPHFNKERMIWSFQTISHPHFNCLAKIFVLDSQGNPCKKHIKPNFVEDFLTPRALAYWIMDDGGRLSYNKDYPRKGFSINTHGFSKGQVEILCDGLKARYGFKCWVKPNKKQWILAISGHDHQKIMELIVPFLVPSMYHKIPV
jgi:hypothetical protein